MIAAGVDAGSRTLKMVLLDAETLSVRAAGVVDQGVEQNALAEQLLDRLLDESGLARRDLEAVVATGYGRKLIRMADTTITEITCQAWGVRRQLPEVCTIVDIGGQDSKLLRLSHDGTVMDFAMNDRCAAGTGRFLEVVATRLGARLEEFGVLARKSRRQATISSMCVVFAETEIVGLLASGTRPEEIAAGVQAAVAARIGTMAGRRLAGPAVFTGGVALVPGMRAALEAALGTPVVTAAEPQTTAALGAAILAVRRLNGQPPPGAMPEDSAG